MEDGKAVNKLRVLYEDNHVIVVVKEKNVLSQADNTHDIDMLTIIKKYLKEKYPNTKSIILTSHENENEIMASIACGARGYILKEMPLEKITEIVKAVNIGAYFFDEKIEHIPLGTIPTPKSTNFDDLYDTPELKNRLTDRELEVLGLLVKGRTNPEIAKELFVSANTVKAHVGSIITKLDVSDRVQAVVKALQLRLIK